MVMVLFQNLNFSRTGSRFLNQTTYSRVVFEIFKSMSFSGKDLSPLVALVSFLLIGTTNGKESVDNRTSILSKNIGVI